MGLAFRQKIQGVGGGRGDNLQVNAEHALARLKTPRDRYSSTYKT